MLKTAQTFKGQVSIKEESSFKGIEGEIWYDCNHLKEKYAMTVITLYAHL